MHKCKDFTEVEQYVANCGYKYSSNRFIIPPNLYFEILTEKQYALRYPGDVMVYKLVQSSLYMCWCTETYIRRYVDAKTFYTQLSLYKFLHEQHDDFHDQILEEILNNDLSEFMVGSIHMF